jgi:N-acetyl-anhydromuramyl-L-alanine amidase AmpD
VKRLLNAIVIHCSATPNFKDFNALGIDAMHKARGFKRDNQARRAFNPHLESIGYHFVIDINGKVETGRGIEEIGAHVQGSNSHSIGICLIGTSKFSDEQCSALKQLMLTLVSKISGHEVHTVASCMTTLKDMSITVKGHRDYSPDLNKDGIIQRTEWMKTCPGFSVAQWIKSGMDIITEDTK